MLLLHRVVGAPPPRRAQESARCHGRQRMLFHAPSGRASAPLASNPDNAAPSIPAATARFFSSSSSPVPINILLGCCNSPIMTPGAPDAGNVAKRCVYKHSSAVLNKCAGNAALRGKAALSARATATGCKTNAKQSKDKLF